MIAPTTLFDKIWADHEVAQGLLWIDDMDLRAGPPIQEIALDRVFIGSCTNSRIGDLRVAAEVVRGRKVASTAHAMVVSREHAPRALEDVGFEAVLAPSFADIVKSACTKIGLLAIVIGEDDVRALTSCATEVDLASEEVRWDGGGASLEIEPETKHRLLNGLDDIALTLAQEDAIPAYESGRESSVPDTTAL